MSDTETKRPLDPRTEKSRREKMAKYGVDDLRSLRRVGERRMTPAEKRKRKAGMDRLRVENAIHTLKVAVGKMGEGEVGKAWDRALLLAAADLEIVAGLHHVPVPEEIRDAYDKRQERYSAIVMAEIQA